MSPQWESSTSSQQGMPDCVKTPMWDPTTDCFWWIDATGRKVSRTTLKNRRTRSRATPEYSGFVALCGPGRAMVGMEMGIRSSDGALRNDDCTGCVWKAL